MEFIPPSEQLCYVRCNSCDTVLAVGIPCKRSLDTVTVKCGHCSNLSFLTIKPSHPPPPPPPHCHLDLQMSAFQGFGSDYKKPRSSSSSSSMSSSPSPTLSIGSSLQPTSPKEPYVVKPPERRHRLPSAYNRFMKEEIQRIKAANPEIPHREAFSSAAKNWARYVPHSRPATISGANTDEKSDNSAVESFNGSMKQMEYKKWDV